MATVGIAGFGYGIRYEHGLFRQLFDDGWQVEQPEDWLSFGNPWEFERPEVAYEIGFGGTVESVAGDDGATRHVWRPAERVLRGRLRHADRRLARAARQHAAAVVGARGRPDAPRRLQPRRLRGRGRRAGAARRASRACSIRTTTRRRPGAAAASRSTSSPRPRCRTCCAGICSSTATSRSLPDQVAIQLNDTHPAIAVPELMRLLVDEHGIALGARPGAITRGCIAYTNHTLLPEALESWPVRAARAPAAAPHADHPADQRATCCAALAGHDDVDPARGLADRRGARPPRAHGPSRLPRRAQGQRRLGAAHRADEADRVPRPAPRSSRTGSSTRPTASRSRRWLLPVQPGAAGADHRGDRRPAGSSDLEQLEALAPLADDAALPRALRRAPSAPTRSALARADRASAPASRSTRPRCSTSTSSASTSTSASSSTSCETIALYQAIRAEPERDWVPRVKIFAGKAARVLPPGQADHQADQRRRARSINSDPAGRATGSRWCSCPTTTSAWPRAIIPAADLSEQISTAGMEASGTGNMKLALNGALTIGTLDGANIEIRERVGADNMFIFGLTAEEVAAPARERLPAARRGRGGAGARRRARRDRAPACSRPTTRPLPAAGRRICSATTISW